MKNRRFLRFIHNTNNNNYHFHHHHQLLQTVFSEYTEAVTTSLVPIDAILLIFVLLSLVLAVLCGLNEVLASSLADSVSIADAILPPRPPIPPTTIMKVRGLRKSTETRVTEKPFTSKSKKGDVGMAKCLSKKYGNKG